MSIAKINDIIVEITIGRVILYLDNQVVHKIEQSSLNYRENSITIRIMEDIRHLMNSLRLRIFVKWLESHTNNKELPYILNNKEDDLDRDILKRIE